MATDRYVDLLSSLGKATDINTLLESKSVARTTKVEHARLLSLGDMVTLLDRDLTRTDLIHTNTNKADQSQLLLVRLHDNDRARRQVRNVALAVRQAGLALRGVVGVDDGAADLLAEVRAVDDEGLLDCAADGRVPAVVAERGQEGLVDGAAFEFFGVGGLGEHVVEGVLVTLGPEFVVELDVVLEVEGPDEVSDEKRDI